MTALLPLPRFGQELYAGHNFEKEYNGRVEQFELRTLAEADWGSFKGIRHEARHGEDAKYFAACDEDSWDSKKWKERCEYNSHQVIFGLYHNDQLIGVMAVWKNESEERTANWGNVYLKKEYRGSHLAEELYKAREEWTARNTNYDKAIFFIREDNGRSTDIQKKQGAEEIGRERNKLWSDGTRADAIYYQRNFVKRLDAA